MTELETNSKYAGHTPDWRLIGIWPNQRIIGQGEGSILKLGADSVEPDARLAAAAPMLLRQRDELLMALKEQGQILHDVQVDHPENKTAMYPSHVEETYLECSDCAQYDARALIARIEAEEAS